MFVSPASRTVSTSRALAPIALTALILAAVLATVVPYVVLDIQLDAAYAIASKLVLCALTVVLLTGLGWWRRAGFAALPARRDWIVLAPPGLLVVGTLAAVVVAGPVATEPALVVAFAAVAFGIGFSEEGLFRGVVLESMRPWGAVWAMVGTTLAFSLLHLGGLLAGATLEATIAQVLLGGIPFGLALAGLRLTTRSIWPLIAIHAINDFASFLTTGHWEAVAQDGSRFAVAGAIQLGLLIVLALYGLWFLGGFLRRRGPCRGACPEPVG